VRVFGKQVDRALVAREERDQQRTRAPAYPYGHTRCDTLPPGRADSKALAWTLEMPPRCQGRQDMRQKLDWMWPRSARTHSHAPISPLARILASLAPWRLPLRVPRVRKAL
jgi:hypothetical protein